MSIRKHFALVPIALLFVACGGESTPEPETPQGASTPEAPAATPETPAEGEAAPAEGAAPEGGGEAAPAEGAGGGEEKK